MTYNYVFGANLAVRANIFTAGYRFDTTIGPRGTKYPMGSEMELVLRLTQARHQAWHCEKAVVEHLIDMSQITEEWLMRRAVRFGRGQTRLEDKLPTEPLRKWLGVPRYLVRIIGVQALRLALATLKRNARDRFEARWELNLAIGMVTEARRMQQTEGHRDSAPQRCAF